MLTVHAAPVKVVPVRVPARHQVVVKAASGARVVLPRIVAVVAAGQAKAVTREAPTCARLSI